MVIIYANNKLEKQMSSPSEMRKAFGEMASKVSQRLDEIISSPNLNVLMKLPRAKCHPLSGDRKGEWAVSISANHRLIFEIAHDPIPTNEDKSVNTIMVTDIKILKKEDYH